MRKDREVNSEEKEIDLLRLLYALWRHAVAIILAAVLFGAAAFGYSRFMITPLYQAKALMYVNNSDVSIGSAKVNISSGDINAAQALVDTYSVILKTRLTLETVIDKAELPYSYEQLNRMISASAVDGTEVFQIVVTDKDPQEAEVIANTIAEVLPEKIAGIVEGSSVRIVDYAVVPSEKASPSNSKNTAVGFLVGAVLMCALVIVRELLDDEIRSEEDLTEFYDYPILAVIPELVSSQSQRKTMKKGGEK